MTKTTKLVLMTMCAIWGVGLAMTVNGPDKGGTAGGRNEGRGLFAPRVEYDEWTPLGHGDPLKNDPTYDYVPPVLERVRYWIEPPASKQQQQRPSKRPHRPEPTDRRDSHPFLTLVDGPKFNKYRPPPARPTHTTPGTTTDTTLPTTAPPSPVFLTTAVRTTVPPVTRPPPTAYTAPASLTTDPLFAHYKQPSEPLQGPMYLIIEGHSKVKTYGAGKPSKPNAVSESSRRQRRRRRKRRLISSFLKSFL